ncbi:protein BOLA4, chloroplastic/mitochondrial [Momordica charantia]|uniref:Protein BOLA4, chloroplastic/mitochondrial n=1 Tax=Momordica charantia TaxID=3673 RepID=A0A6J1DZG6_MOMCH|nr:protein BOLA4, chloroplastic/mitochondrial [Momordica charantia]
MAMVRVPQVAFRRVLPLFVHRDVPFLVVSRQITTNCVRTAAAAISSRTTTSVRCKSSNVAKYGSANGTFSKWGSSRNLSIRATQVNDSGSIDSPLMQSMENKIKEQLDAQSVTVKDAYGDGRHVSIDVISSAFEGQSAVNRQRMVYKAIWEELQSTVHAVDQMTTRTPAEAAVKNS